MGGTACAHIYGGGATDKTTTYFSSLHARDSVYELCVTNQIVQSSATISIAK